MTLLIAACVPPERGVTLFNRTDVPLSIGFSEAVPPCTDRFLSERQIGDSSREIADEAWSPAVVWAVLESDVDRAWVIAGSDRTQVLLEPPTDLPPCGGQPPDWLPNS